MKRLNLIVWTLFLTNLCISQSCISPENFTWEGSDSGIKAVWNADDTLNVYPNLGGIDVSIKIIDHFKRNTTTKNPSDYGDYTKTNTFFGKGNLALQITSEYNNEPVCVEFLFSNHIILSKYEVFDIDYIGTTDNPYNTYQDSVSFFASSDSGHVQLFLTPLSLSPTFDIIGQSVRSKFILGANGDVHHSDPNGAVSLNAKFPINKFTICYANGSGDADGKSNSQAIKIMPFEFCEAFGSISGRVMDHNTAIPLAGSMLSLYDAKNQPVMNKSGIPYQILTGLDGYYSFDGLPFETYYVRQDDPVGFESVNDIDGVNDNEIMVKLDLKSPYATEQDFFDEMFSPLPVRLLNMDVQWVAEGIARLDWEVYSESNNDFYEILTSNDGEVYKTVGKVIGIGNTSEKLKYAFEFPNKNKPITYIKLTQTDLDGKKGELGVKKLLSIGNKNLQINIHPNPVNDIMRIESEQIFESGIFYNISDLSGKIISTGNLDLSEQNSFNIDVNYLIPSIYILQIKSGTVNMHKKFVKL